MRTAKATLEAVYLVEPNGSNNRLILQRGEHRLLLCQHPGSMAGCIAFHKQQQEGQQKMYKRSSQKGRCIPIQQFSDSMPHAHLPKDVARTVRWQEQERYEED